ncbi:membrane hypothetical protein [Desulfarculales bacterium]
MPSPSPQLDLRYTLDAWPPTWATAVLSLQWLVVLLPGLLVLSEVVAQAQGLDPTERVLFMQRLLLMSGLVQLAQVLWGHRLPSLVGPSAVLMVGMLATLDAGLEAVNSALALGGALTALLGLTGLAGRLGRLYTSSVLSSTLLLIAVSLGPTMRDLFFPVALAAGPGTWVAGPVLFAMVLVAAMLWAQHRLKGLVSSAVLLLGSLAYYLLGMGQMPGLFAQGQPFWSWPDLMPAHLSLDPGVLTALVLCYLALTANELATVELLLLMVNARANDTGTRCLNRPSRAVLISGLGGILAGLWGLPGPVTYSVSPRVLS